MKKTFLLFTMLMVMFFTSKAQFSENFDAVTDGSMPTGWTVFNVDGLTPYSGLSWVTNAWVCKTYGQLTTKAAWSTSYYTPAGVSNDWMFTPAITVPASNPVLKYTVVAQDPGYPDGYELRIMTAVPATGNLTTSTVLLTVAAAAASPTVKTINLSSYAGQSVYIGWRNNSNDMYMLGVDNVEVLSLPDNDIAITSINAQSYLLPGNLSIPGTVKNKGFNAITSFDVTYKIDGGAASAVYAVTGQNILTDATYNFTHNVPANITLGAHTVEVTISNVNGGTDPNLTDNVLTTTITGVSQLKMKKVVLEEYTGINCTYCPDGHKKANQYKALHPNDVFLINIHQGSYATPGAGQPDFRTTFGDALAGQTGLTGYPAGTINRHMFGVATTTALSRGAWATNGDIILATPTYTDMTVTATVSSTTRLLSVTVNANYYANAPAINMMNVALLQDSVPGPQTGGSTYYPEMIVNGSYLHMHMLRHLLTGQWGDTIQTTTSGTNFQKTYTYTIPAALNNVNLDLDHLHIVAFIAQGKQEIVTGGEASVSVTSSVQSINPLESISVYPNPATDNINIMNAENSTIQIYDVFGKLVAADKVINNNYSLNVSEFAKGTYVLKITNGEQSISKKITVL